ncbi:hypothetical protein DFO66_109120 [Brevibacterium sanguinis]|uniref:Uncharacterized protein n=2 Tax=Brevibacterium TaxID=1696 RepID=A0A366IGR6_9MICO|nr:MULTISPECIES: hypothetical protein [Brevibacterium]RBP63688.1 hypothetical protein DFO66_109120 [Brevibacterium sanguinis]RBP70347.1 hypothetical protein DFO65_109120 [Brevibacterium celere]
MSNGNDRPPFPPSSGDKPEDDNSEIDAETTADETGRDSVETGSADELTPPEQESGEASGSGGRDASGPDPQAESEPDQRDASEPGRVGPSDEQQDTVSMSLADREESTGGDPEDLRLADRQDEPEVQSPTVEAPAAPSHPPTAPSPAVGSHNADQAPPLGQSGAQGTGGPDFGPPGQGGYGAPGQNGPGQNGPGQDAPGQGPSGPQYGGPGPAFGPGPTGPSDHRYGEAPYGASAAPGGPGPGQPPHQQYGGPQYPGPRQSPVPQQTGSPGHSQSIPQPAPAPGFAGASAGATRADARPRGRKKGRLPLFIALGSVVLVLVLVAVGFLVINSVNKNNYGPDKVAQDYVTALSKGDFAAAEKIAPSPRPEGTNLDLLSKNFTDGSAAKVSNAKVESSTVDGDSGKVVVSYELAGSTYNVELPAKKEGKQDLFFDKWTLTGPALHVISLDIPAADGMTVNGTKYQAQSGTTSFAVYPGTYEFTIPASKWVGEASDTAEVNFPQAFAPGEKPNTEQVAPLTLNLSLSPTPDFEKEVQKRVEDELKKCFDNKDIKPKCEFINFDPTEIPVGGTDDKLSDLAKKNTAKWTIKDMPQVKASFGVGDTTTGSFYTDKQGSFDFSVEGKQRGSSYFSNGNPLSVSGSVKIDGDKLSVEFFDF